MDLIIRALDDRPAQGAPVTMWAIAFESGTNDVHESPAPALALALQRAGAAVTIQRAPAHGGPSAPRSAPVGARTGTVSGWSN